MKTIQLTAKKWFDSAGNTYFTCACEIDNILVLEIGKTYGYGEHYVHVALLALEEAGLVPNGTKYNDNVTYTSYYVPRMKDL